MSKTYTLQSTYVYPCRYGNTYYNTWRSDRLATTETARCGYNGTNYLYTQYIFDSTTLAQLRNKTITSITLKIYCTGSIPSGSWGFSLAYAYWNGTYAYRGNAAGTSTSTDRIGRIDGDASGRLPYTKSGNYITFDLTNYTLAGLGYMLGLNQSISSEKYFVVDSGSTKTKAVLTVVTNETDYSYTLAYNANGGSDAPANQTGSNTQVNPSYTFTISSTVPTRAGHEFLGWSTSSTATTASYQPGDSITVTSSGTTTLYAVWQTLNTVRIVNGNNLDTYLVYVVNNNTLDPYKITVVNSAGTGLDTYT